MSDLQWNSVTISDEEKPVVSLEDLRELAADLDPDDFDEPVQEFLHELMNEADRNTLQQAATLLLQDEVDLSPDLADMGVEPDTDLITLLLAAGADVNARNAYGQPPLHLAAFYGYEAIVDQLLAAGANVRNRNTNGQFDAQVAATPALAAKLEPPYHPEDDEPLPPEIEDADLDPEGDKGSTPWTYHEDSCSCGCNHEHHHECDCDHDHHPGCDCGCNHEHE